MWVYVIMGVAILLLILGLHGILCIAAEKEDHRQALDANETLIRKNRKLEAENRRLHSQLNAKEYQVNSRWELRYEELEAKNRELQRELKIKDALLKAMEGKIEVIA